MGEKPSRSDEVTSQEERERAAKLVAAHFCSLAPVRAEKPCRSEPGSVLPRWDSAEPIPEHLKLQILELHSQPLVTDGGKAEDDVYPENDYYNELIAAEKGSHHTTGSGFIKLQADDKLDTSLRDSIACAACAAHGATRCNPATNDWTPSP